MKKLILILALSLPCFSQNIHVNNVQADGTLGVTGVSTLSGGLNVGKVIRDARQDGVVCDGVTNDAPAITLALTNAYANQQGAVQLPAGQCLVSTTINDTNKTNLDVYGTNSNETYGTVLAGQNFGTDQTQIICNTGATPCWDATGSGRSRLKNFGLRAAIGQSAPSQIGFLFGRDNAVSNGSASGQGTFCFSEENKLENVWVFFDSRPAATAVGTVAVYNVGAEQFVISGGGFIADNPLFVTATNDLSLASPYQTLLTGCAASMSTMNIGDGVVLQAWTKSAMDLRGILDFKSDFNTEILNANIGTNHSCAITINSGANIPTNLDLAGQDEGFDCPLNINTPIDSTYLHVTAVAPSSGGLVAISTGSNISNSVIKVPQVHGTIQPLFSILSGTATISGSTLYESSAGSGAGAAGITCSGCTIYAPAATDTAVNTFNAASAYQVYDVTGNSFVGPVSFGGQIKSTITTGTPPLVIASTTNVPNLNASSLGGGTFAAPGAIGGTTPGSGAFTSLTASSQLGVGAASVTTAGILENNSNLTGTQQIGVQSAPQCSSASTIACEGARFRADTAAASFTTSTLNALHVVEGIKGAGSTITNETGILVDVLSNGGTNLAIQVANSIKSTLATGTAPLIIASTTPVANLSINGGGTVDGDVIGGVTPAAGSFTTLTGTTHKTTTNCAVNSASPAACGSAAAGVVAVPTLTTTYTVNTTAVTANSRIFLQPTSDNTGIPSSPTCATLAVTAVNMISARVAATSFTFSLPSTTGITCFGYWIVN